MVGRSSWVILMLAIASLAVPSASAQETTFHYELVDDAFDEGSECTLVWDANIDGGCDLLAFRATNDAEVVTIQFLMGTVTWPNAANNVNIRFIFTSAGTTYIAQAAVTGAGGVTTPSFGSDPGPSPDGLAWAVDTTADTLTGTFPMASIEGLPGSEVRVDAIQTRLGTAAGTLTAIMDDIPEPPVLTLLGAATESVPGGELAAPATLVENVTADALAIDHRIGNATSDTYVFNWQANLTDIDIFLAAGVATGTANVAIVDGNGTTVFATQLNNASHPVSFGNATADRNASLEPTAVVADTAPGLWTVTIEYADFTGDLALSVFPHEVAEVEDVHEQTVDVPPPAQDSPGFGLLALLGAVAIALRRRT